MIDTIESFADIWFRHLASASLQATLLALILIAVVLAGRRWPPALRHALLMIALLKFVIPPTLSLPTGFFSRIDPDPSWDAGLLVIQAPPVVGEMLWPAETARPAARRAGASGLPGGKMEQPVQAAGFPNPAPAHHSLTARGWLLLLHLFGAMSILALAAAQKIRLHSWACRAMPATDPVLLETFDELCLSLRPFRRPVLRLSQDNHAPMTFGAWRPVVVLPLDLVEALPPAEIRVILGHELAHHRRLDLWLGWLQIPISALWWFHPVYWLLARQIRSVREDCCDDLVVASGLTTREGYCRTLLQAARVASGNALAGAALAYIGEAQPLRRRFRRIMSARFIAMPKLAATGFLTVAALGLLLLPGVSARVIRPVAAGAEASVEPRVLPLPQEAKLAGSQTPAPIQERTLSDSYRKWLDEDVVYIITREERNVFLALASDQEREHFIEQFWARREPDPRKGGDQFKKEHYRRIAYANEHFSSAIPGWKTDRGRIYILYGEPRSKELHPTGDGFYMVFVTTLNGASIPAQRVPANSFERWRYPHIDGMGDNIEFAFVDQTYSNNFVLTDSPLPYALRIDYLRHSADKTLVTITAALEDEDLQQFKIQTNNYQVQVRVYGKVTDLQGRSFAEFENLIPVVNSLETLGPGTTKRTIWQKQLDLPPGRNFQLNLIFKTPNDRVVSSTVYQLPVPNFDDGDLQASSVILANSVYAVPPSPDPVLLRSFVLGDMKVTPNVRCEYTNGQNLIYYLQVYNAALDPATGAPSLQISYAIKSGDRVLIAVEDPAGKAVQSATDERAVLVGALKIDNLRPDKYTLAVKVVDRIANKILVTGTDFRVLSPPER